MLMINEDLQLDQFYFGVKAADQLKFDVFFFF